MRTLVIATISLLGRYAVLILIPPVVLVVWAWSLLWGKSLWLLVVLAFPVLLIVMATIVLVLGMLIAGSGRPRGRTVSKEDAPDLWTYWEMASPPTAGTRRQIIVNDDINAAMNERPRLAGLFGRDQTLIVGLGMLLLLDRSAFEAVLQHEFAHADLKHSHGLTRLNEFVQTYETFEGYIEFDLPVVALALAIAFNALNDWLEVELLRQSRRFEFEADRQSADRLGAGVEARAQIICEGGTHLANLMIFEPLETELRGALAAPLPPLSRMLERRAELIEAGNLRNAITEIIAQEPDPDSTHPSLKERLASLAVSPDMNIGPVGPPAFETMLPADTRSGLLAEFNRQWTAIVNDNVGIE